LPEMLGIANQSVAGEHAFSSLGVEASAAILLASATSAHRPAYPVAVRGAGGGHAPA